MSPKRSRNLLLEAKYEGTKNLWQAIRFHRNRDGSVSFATGIEWARLSKEYTRELARFLNI